MPNNGVHAKQHFDMPNPLKKLNFRNLALKNGNLAILLTQRLHVSRDLLVTPCVECVFMLAFLRVYLRLRKSLVSFLVIQ